MKTATMTAALATLLPLCASAESFRCGKWIIDNDTPLPELKAKCGEPSSRTSRTEDVRAPNQYSGGTTKVGETVIETWIYERGPQAASMVVTIIDGRIKSIERKN
jgi:uncharacterized protein DUF2845